MTTPTTTFVLIVTYLMVFHLPHNTDGQQDQNIQFDQILKDLDILTRQQLNSQTNIESTTSRSTNSWTVTPSSMTATTEGTIIPKKVPTSFGKSSSRLDSQGSSSNNQKVFQLPSNYDPNNLPRFSRTKPVNVGINMTILHVNVDKQDSSVHLDVELIECWRDKRLRIRKNDKDGSAKDDEFAYDEDEEEEIRGRRQRIGERYLLEPSWSARIWHPLSRLQGNAVVLVPFASNTIAISSKNNVEPKSVSNTGESSMINQKTIEHENSIQNIVVVSNETTAKVILSLKIRIKMPLYECIRDDSSRYPFDKVKCGLNIVNAIYDRRNLVYTWNNINWLHNGYQTGEFYLGDLTNTITSEPLLDLDKDQSEHSTIHLEMQLRRQIGDYVLNVYLLHTFLLALCVASFWISIDNIIIRMSLTIIVLIIIKFQTIQSLKEDHHIVSALSIWTFGLSCLVILALLCHILSYYSIQHKWNDKILNRLIAQKSDGRDGLKSMATPGDHISAKHGSYTVNSENNVPKNAGTEANVDLSIGTSSTLQSLNESRRTSRQSESVPIQIGNENESKSLLGNIRQRLQKVKQNSLQWLNSLIIRNSRKNEGYDRTNLVDIISRYLLLIIYILFVFIYFATYVF